LDPINPKNLYNWSRSIKQLQKASQFISKDLGEL
jgi:hypothetical protein